MNPRLQKMAAKAEQYFFSDPKTQNILEFQIFKNYFEDNYALPFTFIKFLAGGMNFSLVVNTLFAFVIFLVMPLFFSEFWSCSRILTLWLGFLSLLNLIIICPKIIISQKIYRILRKAPSKAGHMMWKLFDSSAYRFETETSRCIYFTYLSGFMLIWFCDRYTRGLFWLCLSLLISFIMRINTSYYKFKRAFAGFRNTEMLIEYFSGKMLKKISSLKRMKFGSLAKEPCSSTCAVCYEDYLEDSVVKIMECAGDHVFHDKCIDRWLIKSEKCPMCKYSVFYQRFQDQSDCQYD